MSIVLPDLACLDRPPSYLGYSQISQWIDSLGGTLRAKQFVAVAAVLRGGLFPAQCAAFATGAPLWFIRYDRGRQEASWHGGVPPPGRLLLCEDIAGHGHTLVNCRALVRRTHPDHRVLTIVSDELSRVRPDWSMHRPNVQTVLPWEREVVSPQFRQDYWHRDGAHGREPMKPDHCYRRWGIDLDGVLCDDLPAARYEADMAGTLTERDALPRAQGAPQLTADQHVIVTGRPLADRHRTRAWLDARGYSGIAVHHRDPAVHAHDDLSIAAHKASTAERLGITDFLESCAHQAILISARAPQIRVFWWHGGDPVLVNAHPTPPQAPGMLQL
ncbi:phosphoribosyltransferase [Schlegelella sp. S2-27]|uniref:Phosphoribosyltransferase n=1 Tax=Caldimonas mangrovi TaxID=2944811 RepID=A0ABT0YVT3_9BURK|nr:phosphoribosyltransferase [Caldimonas mangrovi]MCM5681918.1 phosphoribosyltransferase [Caldimonas mangrovi]